MTEVAALGLSVEGVSNIDRATSSLDRFAESGDRAERSVSGVGTESGRSAKSVDTLSTSSGRANTSLASLSRRAAGVAASLGLVVSASAAIRSSIATFASFEESMSRVQAITRSNAEEMAALSAAARELGATTEFSAAQAASGLEYLGLAGFTATQSIQAIPDVLNLATAASLDLGRAADISSNIMSAFGIAADNASRVTDVLAASSSRANTNVDQLGDAMSYVGPVAAAMGIDIGDAAAAVGVLSDAGIQGSSAGTGLRRVLSSLANPTRQAQTVLERLGVSLSDVNPQTNDLADIVDRLSQVSLDASDALTIFGDRGGPAILALVENNARLSEMTGILRNVEGEADRMASTMRDNLTGDVKGLMSAIQELTLALDERGGLGARLRTVTQALTEMVRTISGAISDGTIQAFADDLGEVFDIVARVDREIATWSRIGQFFLDLQTAIGGSLLREGALAFGVYGNNLDLLDEKIARVQRRLEGVETASLRNQANRRLLAELEELRQAELAAQGDLESRIAINARLSQELEQISERMIELSERRGFAASREASNLAERQEEIIAMLDRANSGFMSQEQIIESLGGAVDGWRSPLERVNDQITLMHESVENLRVVTATSNSAIEDMVAELEAEHRQLTMTDRELVEYAAATALGDEANKAGAKSVISHVLALYDQNEALKKTKEEAEEAAKEIKNLQSIIDRYDRSGARLRQLKKDHAGLQQAMAMGLPGAKEAMDAYNESIKAVEQSTETLAVTTEESSGWMATAFERGVERMRDGIGDFFERMIVDGRASFNDLTDLFKKMIAEMIATAAANRIMIGLGFMGAAGGASAGGLGGGGGAGGLGNLFNVAQMANTFKQVWSGIQGLGTGQGLAGFSGLGGGLTATIGHWASNAGNMISSGLNNLGLSAMNSAINEAGYRIAEAVGQGVSVGQATLIGSAATAGAGWAGGYAGAGLGRDLFGKEGSGWGATGGAIIGSYWGPVGSALGGLIGGVVDSIFGSSAWNTTRGGLQLGFGEDGFDPMQWTRQTKKGGLFSSTSRRYRFHELDEELDAALNETYSAALDGVREMYGVLGVAVEDGLLESVQIETLKIGTSGKSKQTQEQIDAQITQWFADLQEAAVQAVDSSLNTETLTIYASSLASVNEVFGAIGLAAYDVSIEGGRLSAQLLQLAGGIENLLNATDFYYQNFYSEQERLANLTGQTTAAFEAMGLVMPGNRAEFRLLVESIDQTTEAGQALFLQLLNLAPAMHDIAGATEAAYQELLGSAQDSLRSAWGALEASVRNEQQSLREAWNVTRSSIQENIRTVQNAMRETERVASSLGRTLQTMRGNSLAFDPSMQFTEASDYLRSVLASGGLGDQDRLDRALAVVANPSAGTYETLVDYQRDFLQTAGVVEELEARAGKQLSAQERSVTALERQLALAESQFELEMTRLDGVLESQARMIEEMIGQQDWLASINAGILSIPDAIAALGASIRNAQQVQRDASMTPTESTVSQAYRNLLGREADAEGFSYWTAELVSGRLPTGQLIDTMRRVAIQNGEIPRFSGGGIATGPNSGYLAELHGREAVVPIPNGHIPVKIQGNDGVRQEIVQLREDLRNANRALIKSNEKMREILQMWNQTGMPGERDLQ